MTKTPPINHSPAKEILACQSVSLRYNDGPYILKSINLTIRAGDFYFLTGPSGAGKSTLLRLLYLGLRPASGTMHIFGQDAHKMKAKDVAQARQKIGVVFQDYNLLEHLTVIENVILPLKVVGADPQKRRVQAAELLSWVGLGSHLNAYPVTLSGGQRQRVSIARAVITRPQLLLADEPTGNVDEKLALKLLYLFDELQKSGTAVVIATHHRDFAKMLGYPEMTIQDGKLGIIGHDAQSFQPISWAPQEDNI